MQDRQSVSVNSNDTSISKFKQLDTAIAPSAIASLSSGEFVGMIADDPDNKIELMTFCCEVVNNHEALKKEHDSYKGLPEFSAVSGQMINDNYLQIKKDILNIIDTEIDRMLNTPEMEGLMVRK